MGSDWTTTALERKILNDVQARTGLSFVRLGGIDTRNKQIAGAVLPVLSEWVQKLKDADPGYRSVIYARFDSPNAHLYMDRLVDWWEKEEDKLAAGVLTCVLAKNAKPKDAERLWRVAKKLPHRLFWLLLLAKLTTFPTVSQEVRDEMVEVLKRPGLTIGDLEHIAKVNDPRIRKWFAGQLDSNDPNLRRLAQRVLERGKKLPKNASYATDPPDRTEEVFSTEADLEELEPTLKEIGARFGLKIPRPLLNPTFLNFVEVDRWIRCSISRKSGVQALLWFRLEDVDVVEVVITGDA